MTSAKFITGAWGLMTYMTDEGPIAHARQRALELGEECLALIAIFGAVAFPICWVGLALLGF
jgi:hypothetical protein